MVPTYSMISSKLFRDVLGFPFTDVGRGWLILDLPEADMGVHPTGDGGDPPNTHTISFYTDDIEAPVAELKEKGVEFPPVEDQGFGLVTFFKAPGELILQLYQPHYSKGA